MTTSTAWGPAFPVNSTTRDDQFNPKLCSFKDGSFLAVWVDSNDANSDTDEGAIRGQFFHADGSKKGGEFLISASASGSQAYPEVAMLNDGRFVVAWHSDLGSGVRARAFKADGTPIGNDFEVIGSGNDDFGLTALSNGGFAVANYGISDTFIQSFDANLQKLGSEAMVSRSRGMEVIGLQDRYMAFSGEGGTITGYIRNNDGSTPVGATEFTVTLGADSMPAVAKLSDGRVIVVWREIDHRTAEAPSQIKGQILNPDGSKSGGELLLSAPGLSGCQSVSLTALADGGFAVAYIDDIDGRNFADVRVSAFDGSGTRVGADTIVGRSYEDGQSGHGEALDVTALADGRLAVTWKSYIADWDDFGFSVHGQIVDLRQTGVTLTGTAGDDRYYGSRFNDSMKGEAGNDMLSGQAGNDAIAGGLGNDNLTGGEGSDNVAGDAGDDMLFGQGERDTLTGGDGSDAFVFDAAPMVGRAKHVDRITDFNGRADKIYLDDAIFKGLSKKVGSLDLAVRIDKKAFWKGNAAHDKDDRIVVKSSGDVLYDADGTGKGKAVVVAKLDRKALKFVDAGDFFEV
ncbi:calcium-binding protein [Microvirga sp. CF3016]|uniref:calcium-binding protein n=1 Tax=Microvirga sp. CF3016 TaxID=3110181 RepID=UPI002E763B7C|nr:calcium-binding protein [Microvirga sp. CF3016]MEE1611331.1 calcium-binding protein [Microvirga sp. CF3016]